MRSTVKQGQSLLDISLQHAGGADSSMEIALENGLSVSDDLEVGDNLEIHSVIDKRVISHYHNNGIIPATWQPSDLLLEGIGYWRVEMEFLVS